MPVFLILFQLLELLLAKLSLLQHFLLFFFDARQVVMIELGGCFFCLASEGASLLLNFVVISVEDIARFKSKLVEELPIIVLLFDFCILFGFNLPELFILDVLKHLLFLFEIFLLFLGALNLNFLDSLDPLLVSHVQLSPLVILASLEDLVLWSAELIAGRVDQPCDCLTNCAQR